MIYNECFAHRQCFTQLTAFVPKVNYTTILFPLENRTINMYVNVCPSVETIWAKFLGSAYRKHRIGAYGSREFCAYGKRISRVSGEFGRLRVRSPHSTLTRLAQKFGGIAIVSADLAVSRAMKLDPVVIPVRHRRHMKVRHYLMFLSTHHARVS